MSERNQLASAHTPQTPTRSRSTFDTDSDSDEEWWNDEDVEPQSQQKTTPGRTTLWPSIRNERDIGGAPKTLGRAATRKSVKRYSVQKPVREKSRHRQKLQNAKAGIKVFTNFSRHQGPPPTQQNPVQTPQIMRQQGCFVDLAALQALDGTLSSRSQAPNKAQPTVTLAAERAVDNQQSLNVPSAASQPKCKPSRSRGTIPAPLGLGDELSPSDRPIPIDISIPSSTFAQRISFSTPQTATSATSEIIQSYGSRSPAQYKPSPTIIITPAQERSYWSPFSEDSSCTTPQARATSSIYSRATNYVERDHSPQDVPPVPHMSTHAMEVINAQKEAEKRLAHRNFEGTTVVGEQDDDDWGRKSRKSRPTSSCTVFEEEDETPIFAATAKAVPMTEFTATKSANISPISTRRRSKGWWTYIVTPFLTRSNTMQGVSDAAQQTPAVPSLADAVAKLQDDDRDRQIWEKQFSPMSAATSTTFASDEWWNKGDSHAGAFDSSSQHKPQESSATSMDLLSAGSPVVASKRRPHDEKLDFAGFDSVVEHPRSPATTILTRSTTRATAFSPSDRNVPIVFESPAPLQHQSFEDTRNPFVQPRVEDIVAPRAVGRPETRLEAFIAPNPTPPARPPPVARLSTHTADDTFAAHNPPPYSPPRRYRAVTPPPPQSSIQYPSSPGPFSPGLQQAMTRGDTIPMSEVSSSAPPRAINLNSSYPATPQQQYQQRFPGMGGEMTPEQMLRQHKKEKTRRRHEKEEAVVKKAGSLWKGRGCLPKHGCAGRNGPEGRKKRRLYFWLIAVFLALIILIIALATTLVHHTSTVLEPSQWLNLTGFPPIYTGVSTVVAPSNTVSNTGCVFPATVWSCDLPKELQQSVSPNAANQPNFRLQIQWDNSSATNATFSNVTGNPDLPLRRSIGGNAVSAGHIVRSLLVKARQIVTFTPSPSAPSYAEEFFLGNTTDGIVSADKAGEPTPFYVSFLNASGLVETTSSSSSSSDSKLRKRASTSTSSTTHTSTSSSASVSSTLFPNITDFIPAASTASDGVASPANLLPLPVDQLIRLYDRGLPTEHYGFYNYYDRSIFLSSLNTSTTDQGGAAEDQSGGSTEADANFVCTWSQTRFLVQMWTRMNTTSQLLNSTSATAPPRITTQGNSSAIANDFSQPGSFPYPITVTVDRHGGDPETKLVYCYELDAEKKPIEGSQTVHEENRAFGGTDINPAPNVFTNTSDPSLGGFDGGTSGCGCGWQNFVALG